jgi:hypothetical protein
MVCAPRLVRQGSVKWQACIHYHQGLRLAQLNAHVARIAKSEWYWNKSRLHPQVTTCARSSARSVIVSR